MCRFVLILCCDAKDDDLMLVMMVVRMLRPAQCAESRDLKLLPRPSNIGAESYLHNE